MTGPNQPQDLLHGSLAPHHRGLWIPGKRGGRKPVRTDARALHLNQFSALDETPPPATHFWDHRAAFGLHSFGNLQHGDCTRAKQAMASLLMERLETRHTTQITEEEVVRVYYEMTARLYGGGDTGAYETDALSAWRRPEETFRDYKGRPLTIEAYLRVNAGDQEELRRALYLAGPHGIAICLNLPAGFANIEPPADWDIPDGQPPVGPWEAGSWGGHSMWARDYDEVGIWVKHTWELPDQRLTWRAAALYLDEAHVVVDSLDFWRTAVVGERQDLDLVSIRHAVNAVSSRKIP